MVNPDRAFELFNEAAKQGEPNRKQKIPSNLEGLFVCLFACLLACLLVCLFVCFFVCLFVST